MTLLIGDRELCVCDIMAALDLPQSTVSRHLSSLRNAGLVVDRRQGVWMNYRISQKGIEHGAVLFDLLAKMVGDLEQTVEDRRLLNEHLESKKKQICC